MGRGDGGTAADGERGGIERGGDRVWSTMEEADWLEAFACHPRIGERKAAHATAQSVGVVAAGAGLGRDAREERVLAELAEGNALYEERFGFTYIVCATGKSAEEMLAILNRRLASDRATELREAAEQQRQITADSIGKVVGGMSRITTHVLDTVLGKPAAGIAVRLEMTGSGEAHGSATCGRSVDGRRWAMPRSGRECAAGRLSADVSTRALICEQWAHEHLSGDFDHLYVRRRSALSSAALLSDNSYTTYRGS